MLTAQRSIFVYQLFVAEQVAYFHYLWCSSTVNIKNVLTKKVNVLLCTNVCVWRLPADSFSGCTYGQKSFNHMAYL